MSKSVVIFRQNSAALLSRLLQSIFYSCEQAWYGIPEEFFTEIQISMVSVLADPEITPNQTNYSPATEKNFSPKTTWGVQKSLNLISLKNHGSRSPEKFFCVHDP